MQKAALLIIIFKLMITLPKNKSILIPDLAGSNLTQHRRTKVKQLLTQPLIYSTIFTPLRTYIYESDATITGSPYARQ